MTNDLTEYLDPADDTEMAALVEAWRYRGPATPWDTIVGHEPQVEELKRIAALVRTAGENSAAVEALGIRTGGKGALLMGPPGVGKTLAARALASACGRRLIVPPTAEVDAALIRRLYSFLGSSEPTVVVWDESDRLVGTQFVSGLAIEAQKSLLAALDPVDRPGAGPLTVCVTSLDAWAIEPAVARPGRLAPRLLFGLPTRRHRRMMFGRALASRPVRGEIDVDLLTLRTDGWSGAEVEGSIQDAAVRALADGSMAIKQEHVLEAINARFAHEDVDLQGPDRSVACHEAGHALASSLTAGVESVLEVRLAANGNGSTRTASDAPHRAGSELLDLSPSAPIHVTVAELRRQAIVALAGMAAERVVLGADQLTTGSESDIEAATLLLMKARSASNPWSVDVLEGGAARERGSESMRADLYREIRRDADEALAVAESTLLPYVASIEWLASVLLVSPDFTLSGDDLHASLVEALALSSRAA